MATVVFALLLIPSTLAVTTASNSTEQKSTWTPEPRGRGTWSILSNCIFTLIICIWTVIHDDVPIKDSHSSTLSFHKITPFSRLLSKLQWMLYAFLAPEHMIIMAYSQWKRARSLQKEFCSIIGDKRPGSKDDILGLEGSFFVNMGGFSSGPIQPDGEFPDYLDSERFISLVKEKGVPDSVNLRLINARGKGDAIGKLLAIIQALSLVIQCLLRKIDSLSVTLLEFHVVIQVFFAIIIYGFWWSKPQGVMEPMPFEQPATRFAELPPAREVSGKKTTSDNQPIRVLSLSSLTGLDDIEQANLLPIPQANTHTTSTNQMDTVEIFQRPSSLSLFSWETIEELHTRLRHWDNAGRQGVTHLHIFNNIKDIDIESDWVFVSIYALYGAVHSIAWNSSFPTPLEQLLWRVSCVSLIVTVPLMFSLIALLIRFSGLRSIIIGLVLLGVFHVMICRSYLTIECFISLRLLPANAYQTVTWETIWPHI